MIRFANLFFSTLLMGLFLTPEVAFSQKQKKKVPTFRKTIISAEKGIHLPDQIWNEKSVDFPTFKGWSVEKKTLHGGKQEGSN